MELADFYNEINTDSAMFYAQNAVKIARKNNKRMDEAEALDVKGYNLIALGKYSESLQCFLIAFKIAEDEANENKTWFRDKKISRKTNRLNKLLNLHHDFGHLMGPQVKLKNKYNNTKQQENLGRKLETHAFWVL